MEKLVVLSKVLGSKYFEKLWDEDKPVTIKLNIDYIYVNFNPKIKFLEIEKNVGEAVIETMQKLEKSIESSDQIYEIYNKLDIAGKNQYFNGTQEDKIDYLYKDNFDAIYGTLFQHIKTANEFVSQESVFKSATDLYELNINQKYCEENWLAKYTPLFEKIIEEEAEQLFNYDSNYKQYQITRIRILIDEGLFTYRQLFKCRFVKISKALSKKHKNFYVKGVKYSD